MTALDMEKDKYLQSAVALTQAAGSDDSDAFKQATIEFASVIEQEVLAQYRQEQDARAQEKDSAVLLARGHRQLTTEETKFYQAWISAAKSQDPKQAITGLDAVMPETIINDVFKDLTTDHPLLDLIDFQNTGAVTQWIINKNPRQLATWSKLCAAIVTELTSEIESVNLTLNKLSAFMPICKAMLDLGPEWLDVYVRRVLEEAIYLGLEEGIVNGNGLLQPIGMNRDVGGSLNPTTGLPEKTPIVFTSFNAVAYGQLLAKLATNENGTSRKFDRVFLIVNPTDYFNIIFPATTVRTTDGSYNANVFPFPTTVIQSTAVASGKAIIGLPDRYFMGIGTGKSGKIEYSDEYRFLEDERVYLTKLYGHGQPKDNNAFQVLDITNLVPEVLTVNVLKSGEPNTFAAPALLTDAPPAENTDKKDDKKK